MTDTKTKLLQRKVSYSGDGLSVRSLETMIDQERTTQDTKVQDLKALRERNVTIHKSLEEEVAKLRHLSDYVSQGRLKGGVWSNLKELLSYVPGMKSLAITKRSIEELLRQQYEISARRVKEAAEYVDRLEAAEQDLYDEIERLNARIIEAARNEATAAEYVIELQEHFAALTEQHATLEASSVEGREVSAEIDRTRRVLAEHSTQLKLFDTAEERLARLKQSTDMLAQTIANLRSDISQYVMAAGEKLDLVAGQIRAIGTAADASVVILEMKKSLDSMGESLNQTTRFVSETQAYFRDHLDTLVGDLEVFDKETRSTLERNLEAAQTNQDKQIAEAVEIARTYKAAHSE